jgi:hypothetical protein
VYFAIAIDVNILRQAVAEMIAGQCRRDQNPDNALREFSERLHTRVNSGPMAPDSMQSMIEVMRDRIDALIRAAQVSLQG